MKKLKHLREKAQRIQEEILKLTEGGGAPTGIAGCGTTSTDTQVNHNDIQNMTLVQDSLKSMS